MTELQILRNALFDEIKRIKRGTADLEETKAIVSTSNAIISTYNTELKGAEVIMKASEVGADAKVVKVFDNTDKNQIEYQCD